MSGSRPVLPGTKYVITRRTTRRKFLLKPDRKMTELFWYLLAVLAHKHGVKVHCVVCMSTHYHAVITDVRGVAPDFFAGLHRSLAMGIKCNRAWDEEVWNKSQTSRVELTSDEAIVNQCAYVIANPVEAGIVDRPRRYPGAKTLARDIGKMRKKVKRPDCPWLVDDDVWPAELVLVIEMPVSLVERYGEDGAREQIQHAVDEMVADIRRRRRERGLGYVGAKRAMTASHETESTAVEPLRDRNPTFAVVPGNRELFLIHVALRRQWRASYEAALERWRGGDRDVEFPAGTWKMRVVHGARVAPPPE